MYLFMYCPWLLLCYSSRAEEVWCMLALKGLKEPKIWTFTGKGCWLLLYLSGRLRHSLNSYSPTIETAASSSHLPSSSGASPVRDICRPHSSSLLSFPPLEHLGPPVCCCLDNFSSSPEPSFLPNKIQILYYYRICHVKINKLLLCAIKDVIGTLLSTEASPNSLAS